MLVTEDTPRQSVEVTSLLGVVEDEPRLSVAVTSIGDLCVKKLRPSVVMTSLTRGEDLTSLRVAVPSLSKKKK